MSLKQKQINENLVRIFESSPSLETPSDLFSGLTLSNSFAPDNILFFRRTHTRAFRPDGVSNNFHHRFELVVVFRKSGSVRIGNYSHVLNPLEAFLVFPNQFHHYMDVEEGDLEWLFITFELGKNAKIEPLRDSPRALDSKALDCIERIVHLRLLHESGEDHTLEISYQLSKVLGRLMELPEIDIERRRIHSSDDVRDVLLERVNAYVRQNLNRQITISDLAEKMEYSVSYLRALFRDRLGVSLGRYIRESRLSCAAQLLQQGDISVTEVSEQTGFDSLFAFSRAFKNAYGVSPKAYTKLVKRDS